MLNDNIFQVVLLTPLNKLLNRDYCLFAL